MSDALEEHKCWIKGEAYALSCHFHTFLYAYESWTLMAALKEKKTSAFEIRCYHRLLNISYKDHATNGEVRRKIQAATGEYDELLNLVKKQNLKLVWSRIKVFCYSKDDSTWHNERKKKKRWTNSGEKIIIRMGRNWLC